MIIEIKRVFELQNISYGICLNKPDSFPAIMYILDIYRTYYASTTILDFIPMVDFDPLSFYYYCNNNDILIKLDGGGKYARYHNIKHFIGEMNGHPKD